MIKFIVGLFTDANGQPEIKNVAAFTFVVIGLVLSIIWLFWKQDVTGSMAIFGGISGFGFSGFIVTAVSDNAILKINATTSTAIDNISGITSKRSDTAPPSQRP